MVHVDEGYADPTLASLYDAECPWHPQDDFYQALDLAAASVLDVGCGTGTRLVSTRMAGHRGRLVGVDPAPGMLAVARAKSTDVEWQPGAAQTLELGERFALVTMTGHVFQCLLTDADVTAALAAFHRHLELDGLLAFESRNPEFRAWQGWTREAGTNRIADPGGTRYETWVDGPSVDETPGDGVLVTFTSGTRRLTDGWTHAAPSTLRFLAPEALRAAVEAAGFVVEGWYGDWDRSPVAPTAPELIVLARPA